MSIATITRNIIGPKLFSKIGRLYRAFFVNLETVADILSKEIPPNSHVLDIGGGDGEPMNYLLKLRPDITVTMTDIQPNLASMLKPEFRNRVTILPETSLHQLKKTNLNEVDAITICDVIHHITSSERRRFFTDLAHMIKPHTVVLIKDVEPGSIISVLGFLSDRCVTGDPNTNLISREKLSIIIKETLDPIQISELPLYRQNKPNYLLKAARPNSLKQYSSI